MCCKCTASCRWWAMNETGVYLFWEMWSVHEFCLTVLSHDSQFGPHWLVFYWLSEEFWQCDFSFDQCMLATEKKTVQNTFQTELCQILCIFAVTILTCTGNFSRIFTIKLNKNHSKQTHSLLTKQTKTIIYYKLFCFLW